jgi:hypothetical protein
MYLFAPAIARRLLLATAAATFLMVTSASLFAQDDPPAQAGRLSYVSGAVSIQPVGTDDWGQAAVNYPIGPGDRVFTDMDGRAEIQVGQVFVRIGPNSDVSFVDDTPYSLSIGVAQGSVRVECQGLWPGQWFHVNSPSGSAGLSQPGELRLDVMPDQGAAIFTNYSSDALISGAGGFSQYLGNGQALELIGSNPVFPQWLQPADWDDLDRWSHWRDQQMANAVSYRYVSPEIPGAYELDANGTWLPDTEYGPIWFPNNVAPDWAPYHFGRWVNHAPWGWVWVEDEPWGYAPFHYGRWVSFAGRWGWIPGPPAAHPVWSPALVVFAGGVHVGGVGVSAWFPLGPGEPYHPWYHASPRYIDDVNRSNMGESRRVHVQDTYVNFDFGHRNFANRDRGFSAMRQEDFAAGHSVRQAPVVVDVRVINQVQVIERPEPQPTRQSFVGQPPARPVPVQAARPVLINETGRQVSARPGAQPVDAPVKAAPQVRALPGRTVVAPPPAGTGMHPSRTPGAPAASATQPNAKPGPAPAAQPMGRPNVQPTGKPGVQPAAQPAALPNAKPGPAPAAQPMGRPTAQPTGKPAVQPAAQPAALPNAKPGPAPAAQPMGRPTAQPTGKPAVQPAPQPVAKPAPAPAAQPMAKPTVQPTVKPAAQPAPQPTAKPAPAPATKPAPAPAAQPTARPTPPAAQPAAKPAAPAGAKPQQDRKNDKDKKKDETK